MKDTMHITAWSAVSPYGQGRDVFTEGMLTRRPSATALDPVQWQGPDARACLVPGFDPRAALGKKGTRAMNRVTGLAVITVGALVDGFGDARGAGPDTALVLGTTTGSVQSMMDFTRASLTGDRPFDVDPGVIPNALMNCAAAQCAIWHQIQGPNTTLACGRPSGLFALAYARRLLLSGRAGTVVCGAAEEYSTARSWLEHHSRAAAPGLLGEGAAALRVELTDSPGTLASVLAVESRVRLPQADLAGVVADTVRQALRRVGVTGQDVWAAVPSGFSADETDALDGLFGARALHRVPPTAELFGDTGAVSAMFQLTATLAVAGDAPGRIAVVTSVDVDGMVAAAVLRLAEKS